MANGISVRNIEEYALDLEQRGGLWVNAAAVFRAKAPTLATNEARYQLYLDLVYNPPDAGPTPPPPAPSPTTPASISGWTTLAEVSNPEELSVVTAPIAELPSGTKVLIHIDLKAWLPVGNLADLAGMEWWATKLAPYLTVEDVYGGTTWMEARATVTGTPVALILPLIKIALLTLPLVAGFAIYMYAKIRISADIVKQQVIAAEREALKVKATQELLAAGYTPEQIKAWLEGITTPPVDAKKASPSLDEWLRYGAIGVGMIIVLVIALMAYSVTRR